MLERPVLPIPGPEGVGGAPEVAGIPIAFLATHQYLAHY